MEKMNTDYPDNEEEAALRAVMVQMEMSKTRFAANGADPDFLRGYQEAIYKVTHILGEMRALRIFRERRLAREAERAKPDYVTLCGDVSKGGRTCTNLPHPETGLHYSDEDGVYWGEAGPVVIEKADPVHIPKPQERHFLPAPSAKHATCGAENRAVRVTTFVRDVTCPACKEELGL